MKAPDGLHQFFLEAARRWPEHTAVVEPGRGAITYRALDVLSDRLRDRLVAMGVRPGDRVGIYLPKSIDAVAAIYGILKAGAAYVPVDPGAPPERNAYILQNCAVRAVVWHGGLEERLQAELARLGQPPPMLLLDRVGAGAGLRQALDAAEAQGPAPASDTVVGAPRDLAYILYTSGSTGKPKGVMLSHENGVSFVDWCSEVFDPGPNDRFSSHAPFHFDLSILDVHVSLKHGATLVLVGEDIGKDPERLAALIAEERISIWYSAPSILAPPGPVWKARGPRLLGPSPRALRGRGLRGQASALADQPIAEAAVLQSLRPHGNERLHVLRGADTDTRRARGPAPDRPRVLPSPRQGGRPGGTGGSRAERKGSCA